MLLIIWSNLTFFFDVHSNTQWIDVVKQIKKNSLKENVRYCRNTFNTLFIRRADIFWFLWTFEYNIVTVISLVIDFINPVQNYFHLYVYFVFCWFMQYVVTSYWLPLGSGITCHHLKYIFNFLRYRFGYDMNISW